MDGNNFNLSEKNLYEIWKGQSFKNSLKTSDGENISVLEIGTHNTDSAGPDFKNARIRIGNFTFVGDIEIDSNYSDWKSHGHNIDNKYSKVVLHVTLLNKNNHGYVYTRDGRKVPSIYLSEQIDPEIFKKINVENSNNKKNESNGIKCSNNIKKITDDEKGKFLQKLGVIRFEKKCGKIFQRIKELHFLKELNVKEPVISYEFTSEFQLRKFTYTELAIKEIWQQLFYELIFEALGFSKNKVQMINLAQAANINFIKNIEKDGIIIEKYEAVLLKISGLAKDQSAVSEMYSKKYLERMALLWNSISSFYDGKIFDETDWHFFRLRPQNFPTVRIAGGARILYNLLYNDLIAVIVKKITEINNLSVLINSLRSLFVIKTDGFWKKHYVFDQLAESDIKYFVGASRADEIVVNVIIPFFAVYFDVFGHKANSNKIVKLYSIYQQKSENQIIIDVAQALDLGEHLKKTVLAQGMLELFRNYCSKNKCLECEIGKSIFN
jgi:hypothetical protein